MSLTQQTSPRSFFQRHPPGVNFPAIIDQATTSVIYEPLSFTSPDLAARMECKLKQGRLIDFKRESRSLTQRAKNGLTSFRAQQMSMIEKRGSERMTPNKLIMSVDAGQAPQMTMEKLSSARTDCHRPNSLHNVAAVNNSMGEKVGEGIWTHRVASMDQTYLMGSTARDTTRNPFVITTEFGGKTVKKPTNRRENLDLDTTSSIQDQQHTIGQTAQQWIKENALQAGYFTQNISPRGGDAETDSQYLAQIGQPNSAGGDSKSKRPSVISDSLAGSNLMATRIPYKGTMTFGNHRLASLALQEDQNGFSPGSRDTVASYSLANKTPMSPGARQQATLDSITKMNMKARGKLLPGQPTAKQFAEQLRREQAKICPQNYGNETTFVHNTTAKPISGYQFSKFKELHKLTGADKIIDRNVRKDNLTKELRNRRSKVDANQIRNNISKRTAKMMTFKKDRFDLNSTTQKDSADTFQTSVQETEKETSESDLSKSESDTETENSVMNVSTPKENALMRQMTNAAQAALMQSNLSLSRRGRKYDLYLGKKKQEDFIKHLKTVIKKQKPDVNISDIANQYYNREIFHGKPVESGQLVFRKTLNAEKEELFDFKKPSQPPAPLFNLTNSAQLTLPPHMKKIAETGETPAFKIENSIEEVPEKKFTLHNYSLANLQEAYHYYVEARKSIILAAKKTKRFAADLAAIEIHISEHDIVKEIRQNPKLIEIANIIEDPVAHALIRILITYEKYNFESEEAGLAKAVKLEPGVDGEAPLFDEIELMKELVIEFTTAIDERMKEEAAYENAPNSPTPSTQEAPVGRKIREKTKNDMYLTINEYITKHPEFQQIKDEAKQRVLNRIRKYKDSQNSQSGFHMSHFGDSVFDPPSNANSPTFFGKQRSIRVTDPDSTLTNLQGGRLQLQTDPSTFKLEMSQTSHQSLQIGEAIRNLQGSIQNEVASPMLKLTMDKQKSIEEPKRKRKIPRSRVAITQFVQSNQFQEVFNDIIQDLDANYAARRDQNKRASEFLNQQVFYRLAKESVSVNGPENPNIDYVYDCNHLGVRSIPIFSKIRNNMLKLKGYRLNDGYCTAFQNYIEKQQTEEAQIDTLVLHNTSCSDKGFAAILKGLLHNSRIVKIHYSLSEFGPHSNRALLKVLQRTFPNHVKALCLSNLKMTGRAILEERETIMSGDEDGAPQEPNEPKYIKKNVIEELTQSLLHTENLQRLVLQDMELGERAQANIVEFVDKANKLENLQLINCQMLPEYLAKICTVLDNSLSIQSLSFAKNVLRNNPKVDIFAETLTSMIKNTQIFHLELNGMFIGDKGIEKIICEGVAASKTMAAVHFQDNRISHWLRLKIYYRLKRNDSSATPTVGADGNGQKFDQSDEIFQQQPGEGEQIPIHTLVGMQESIILEDEDAESAGRASQVSGQSDLEMREQRGGNVLQNRKHGSTTMDQLLDYDRPDPTLEVENINQMLKAHLTVVRFPQSQNIVNAEVLKAIRSNDASKIEFGTIEHGIQEESRGTLYYRLSKNPQLYSDKVERENYYKDSQWLSVSNQLGCWICNSTKVVQKISKAFQTNLANEYKIHENIPGVKGVTQLATLVIPKEKF